MALVPMWSLNDEGVLVVSRVGGGLLGVEPADGCGELSTCVVVLAVVLVGSGPVVSGGGSST